MSQSFRLNADKSISPCRTIDTVWDGTERIVGAFSEGGTIVSTVFIPIDMSHDPNPHLPVCFETMVFGGDNDGDIERYTSWDEALIGHNRMVEKCKAGDLNYRHREEE